MMHTRRNRSIETRPPKLPCHATLTL